MTVTDSDGLRIYVHPTTGERFRSVTSVLAAAAKPALERWKTRTIAQYAADNRSMLATKSAVDAFELIRSSQYTTTGGAAATGTMVHTRVESLLRGDPVPDDPSLSYVDRAYQELTDEFDVEPLLIESTLVNRTVGYAGSADLVARIRPRATRAREWSTAVIDLKTGKSVYGSMALQLTAYADAEHVLTVDGAEREMPRVDACYVWHLRPRSWSLRPMRYDAHTRRSFTALVDVDRWLRTERDAVGAPVNAAAIARQRVSA
ncbi:MULTISPECIES: hypothetical protein [unclassified Pseudonocardia]|uniref:hypothetical protein n=1 Tax=unclassified Pseudonocardia TaxID=2619320 RepID=UPI001CF6AE29|nr:MULTISPECIES: hypothetical protein [unclassified Pseudonocardia]